METADLALRYGIALLIGDLHNPAENPQKPAAKPANTEKCRTYVLQIRADVLLYGNTTKERRPSGSALLCRPQAGLRPAWRQSRNM